MEIKSWLWINRLNAIFNLKPSCIFPEGIIIFVEYSWQSPLTSLYIIMFWMVASFINALLISLSRKRGRRFLLYVPLFTQKKWILLYCANFLYYGRLLFYPLSSRPKRLGDKGDEIIWNGKLLVHINLSLWHFYCQWITKEGDGDAIKTLLVGNMSIPKKILLQILLFKDSKIKWTILN